MDPIRNLCLVKDSWLDEPSNIEIEKYSEEIIGSPRTIRNKLFLKDGKEDEKEKDEKDEGKIEKREGKMLPISVADPFLKMDSYFRKRSSLILANIDIIYNFTGQYEGYLLPQVYKEFDYLCLDSDPGFLEYLKYRLPRARDFIGYTPNLPLNLVLSNNLNYKENLLKALKLCKEGGTFISRVSSETEDEYLYITSLCFRKVSLFKPLLENLNENYSYFIAEEFKGNSIDIISHLENYSGIKISSSFQNYIKRYYQSINKLRNSLTNEEYNMYRCKAILNLF